MFPVKTEYSEGTLIAMRKGIPQFIINNGPGWGAFEYFAGAEESTKFLYDIGMSPNELYEACEPIDYDSERDIHIYFLEA